jgi:hypothetical protein
MEQIASYAAPVATTIAALIVASNLGSRITGLGFVIFTIGSIAWALLGLSTDQPSLLWQNVVLTALNLFGIWRWLGRQARIEEGAAAAARTSETAATETLFPVSLLTRGTVISSNGQEIGSSVEAMVGCSSGRISYLVVSEGGLAGVGETLRRVPWAGCAIEEERVRVPMDEHAFRTMEQVERDRWPAR